MKVDITIGNLEEPEVNQRMKKESNPSKIKDQTANPSKLDSSNVTEEELLDRKIQQCLKMLQGNTDEHKFAGLLMVTKHLTIELPEKAKSVRRLVFQAVGIEFLKRLLRTSDQRMCISPYQVLGINILSSFSEDEELLEQFINQEIIKSIIQLIKLDPERNTMLDCIRILQNACGKSKGFELVVTEDLPSILFNSLSTRSLDDTNDDWILVLKSGLELLMLLTFHIQSLSSWNIHENVILQLSKKFASFNSKHKIYYLRLLMFHFRMIQPNNSQDSILQSNNGSKVTDQNESTSTFIEIIRQGLFDLLSGRLSTEIRDDCFQLIQLLFMRYGSSWTWNPNDMDIPSSNGAFISLILKLVFVEVKLCLDESSHILINMEKNASVHITLEENEQKEIEKLKRILHILPICYEISEFYLTYLCETNTINKWNWLNLSIDIILQLKQSLESLIRLLLEFLTLARDFIQTHYYQQNIAQTNSFEEITLNALIVSSIRLLGAWSAEETNLCMDEIIEILPFMLTYDSNLIQEEKSNIRNTLIKEPNQIENNEMDSDDEIESKEEVDSDDELESSEYSKPSYTLVPFILPGLLHITATQKGVERIASDLASQKRLFQFCFHICKQMISMDSEDSLINMSFSSSISTLTLCLGIFLNILLGSDTPESLIQQSLWFRSVPILIQFGNILKEQLNDLESIDQPMKSMTLEPTVSSTSDLILDERYLLLEHIISFVLFVTSSNSSYSTPKLVQKTFSDIMKWYKQTQGSKETDLSQLISLLSQQQ